MTVAVLALACAAMVLVAAITSALVGGAEVSGGGLLRRLDARSRLRVVMVAVAAPGAIALAVVVASLLASVLVGDHCAVHDDHHPHLCFAHARLGQGPALVVVIGLAAVRWVVAAASAAMRSWRSWRTERALAALGGDGAGARVVDGMPPFAATMGWLRPRAYVSAAVPAGLRPIVIAHERSHVRNRDPAVRVLAELVLAFHLPGISGRLRRALYAAQEARADADAVHEIGDPVAVADALVRFARLRSVSMGGAAAGFEGDVVTRVEELLEWRRRPSLGLRWIAVSAAAGGAALLTASDAVHHAVETLLGLFGG